MATSFSGGRCRSTRREPSTMGKQLANLFPFVVFNVNLLISYDQSCLKIPEMSYLLLNCYNLFHFIMQCFFYLKVQVILLPIWYFQSPSHSGPLLPELSGWNIKIFQSFEFNTNVGKFVKNSFSNCTHIVMVYTLWYWQGVIFYIKIFLLKEIFIVI